MELSELIKSEGLTSLAARVGVSKSYLSHVNGRRKKLGPTLAVRIYRTTGHKLGPISSATDAEIDALERLGIRGVAA